MEVVDFDLQKFVKLHILIVKSFILAASVLLANNFGKTASNYFSIALPIYLLTLDNISEILCETDMVL